MVIHHLCTLNLVSEQTWKPMELYTDLNLMKYLERAGSKKAEKQL